MMHKGYKITMIIQNLIIVLTWIHIYCNKTLGYRTFWCSCPRVESVASYRTSGYQVKLYKQIMMLW